MVIIQPIAIIFQYGFNGDIECLYVSVKRGHNFYNLACTNSIHKTFYSILNSDSFTLHFKEIR